MAARGALPLEPVDLATVLFALLHDPDDEAKAKARDSLEGLPDSVCATVLQGEAHPALLSTLAHMHKDDAKRMEMLALNPATDEVLTMAPPPRARIASTTQPMPRHTPSTFTSITWRNTSSG